MTIELIHVGVGIRGRHWLEIVRDFPDARTVALVEPDAACRAEAQKVVGDEIPSFAGLEQALAEIPSAAVLIASPSALHEAHATLALAAGRAVLLEKPFAVDVAEATRLNDRAAAANKPLIIAEQFRFVPGERTIRQAVEDGLLGHISSATFVDRRRMPASTQGRWIASIEYPQLQEVAIHHFDSLRSFFGVQPVQVAARVWNPPGSDYRHGANSEALIEMENGLHVQYMGSLTSHKFEYRVWIEGDLGILWSNRRWVTFRGKGKKLFRPLPRARVPAGDERPYPREGTTSLLRSLVAAVRDGTTPETAGTDNIWSLAMLDAAKRSDREGRTVALSEVLTKDGRACP